MIPVVTFLPVFDTVFLDWSEKISRKRVYGPWISQFVRFPLLFLRVCLCVCCGVDHRNRVLFDGKENTPVVLVFLVYYLYLNHPLSSFRVFPLERDTLRERLLNDTRIAVVLCCHYNNHNRTRGKTRLEVRKLQPRWVKSSWFYLVDTGLWARTFEIRRGGTPKIV